MVTIMPLMWFVILIYHIKDERKEQIQGNFIEKSVFLCRSVFKNQIFWIISMIFLFLLSKKYLKLSYVLEPIRFKNYCNIKLLIKIILKIYISGKTSWSLSRAWWWRYWNAPMENTDRTSINSGYSASLSDI